MRRTACAVIALTLLATAATATADGPRVFLPVLTRSAWLPAAYPDPAMARAIWRAVESFTTRHPATAIYPNYDADDGGPSIDNARANVDAACRDFLDLPQDFGAGAHHRACYAWVADYLALYHAARARQLLHAGSADGLPGSIVVDPDVGRVDQDWAKAYLSEALDALGMLAYGPEDAPGGAGYRDTVAAVWQNPMRAVNVAIAADLLRQDGALDAALRARTEERLSAIVRAWYAGVWLTGQQPSTGVRLVTRKAPEAAAFSIEGKQIVPTRAISIPWGSQPWNADKGSSPSEEAAWMGAGAMLSAQVLRGAIPPGEADQLFAAGRHYASFAVAYDRPDPLRGNRRITTLNRETSGGPYGQNRYWIENHTDDIPSIPYVGWTFHYLDAALLASELRGQTPWPELIPDAVQWAVLQASAEASLTAPDGRWLVDFTPGQGLGFKLDPFPLWTMPCGQFVAGRHYVRYDGRAGGPALWVSEIGHPAGLDVLAASWPFMRMAIHQADGAAYVRWRDRLTRVLAEYTARPPDPRWSVCGIAPYVSHNPGYHWSRMLSMYVLAYLGASGYGVAGWEAGSPGVAATVTPAAASPPTRSSVMSTTASPRP